MRRRLDLAPVLLSVLDFLQQDIIGIVGNYLSNGLLDPDRRRVGICVIPDLPKLHVELQYPKAAHRDPSWSTVAPSTKAPSIFSIPDSGQQVTQRGRSGRLSQRSMLDTGWQVCGTRGF
jgi:hypothetical protein